jgi:O-acetyl-ADP-ribose deacetylase (regulator of RNase III)
MIHYVNGNIHSMFDSSIQVITNTINCVGVMGAGITLEFKHKYPEMFADYRKKCRLGQVLPGRPYLYSSPAIAPQMILNFPTKDHWKDPSKLEWIATGLDWIVNNYRDMNIGSIALPQLGCNNGKLD